MLSFEGLWGESVGGDGGPFAVPARGREAYFHLVEYVATYLPLVQAQSQFVKYLSR